MLKRIFAFCVLSLFSSLCYANGWLRIPAGDNYNITTSSVTGIAVSSQAYVTENAVPDNTLRIYQNTGSSNINYFYTVSDSNTVSSPYIEPGDYYIEDQFTGTIYFKAVNGSSPGSIGRIRHNYEK